MQVEAHEIFSKGKHIYTLKDDSVTVLLLEMNYLATVHTGYGRDRFRIAPSDLRRFQELLDKKIVTHDVDSFYQFNKIIHEFETEKGDCFFGSL